MKEEDLFSLMKLEDEGAFKEIYERYFDGLFVHACRKLQDREEARDVVQEVFANLWDKRESITLTGSLQSYLYVAIRNRILNIIAHRKIESGYAASLQHFLDKGICHTDYLARTNDLNSAIEKEVSALPSKMQEIFALSRKQYLSHKEIARELNLSEQTVKKQVNNALKILRVRLGLF